MHISRKIPGHHKFLRNTLYDITIVYDYGTVWHNVDGVHVILCACVCVCVMLLLSPKHITFSISSLHFSTSNAFYLRVSIFVSNRLLFVHNGLHVSAIVVYRRLVVCLLGLSCMAWYGMVWWCYSELGGVFFSIRLARFSSNQIRNGGVLAEQTNGKKTAHWYHYLCLTPSVLLWLCCSCLCVCVCACFPPVYYFGSVVSIIVVVVEYHLSSNFAAVLSRTWCG